jgi:hypothetical protein
MVGCRRHDQSNRNCGQEYRNQLQNLIRALKISSIANCPFFITSPFAPRTQTFGVSGCRDAFAEELTRGSFKTIPASEETTNTQRFESDSLAEGPSANDMS